MIREFLWSEVYTQQGAVHLVGRAAAALKGLAKLDPENTFHAAEAELTSGARDRELIVSLLLKLDPGRAIKRLCEHLPGEESAAVRSEIGRRLRLSGDEGLVLTCATDLLRSSEPAKRKAAAELSGWMGPPFQADELRKLTLDDAEPDVRLVARASLQKQAEESEAEKLFHALESAPSIEQWCYLNGMVQMVDPVLLVHSKHPCEFSKVGGAVPVLMRYQLNHQLNQRREELKKREE